MIKILKPRHWAPFWQILTGQMATGGKLNVLVVVVVAAIGGISQSKPTK